MKKLLVLFAVAALSISAFAESPTGLNIGGGYAMDFSRTNGTPGIVGLFLPDDNNFYGAYVEVGYDIQVAKHSYVCFAARFKQVFTGESVSAYSYFAGRNYIDIPIKYQFCGKIAPNTSLFFTLGPTVNIWLQNRVFSSNGLTGVSGSINYFQSYPEMYNRMNFSLGGSLGVITHHVKIFAAYDQAICNFANSSVYALALGQLRVGAAYVF